MLSVLTGPSRRQFRFQTFLKLSSSQQEAREITEMKSSARNGILLSGYFGCGNLGDDLLLSSAIAGLRPLLPGAQFLIRDGGTTQSENFDTDVTFTGVETALTDQKRSKLNRACRYIANMTRLLRRCRWLIFAGGTVFHEQGSGRSLTIQWMTCRLARLLGVRIAALGVGIAQLNTPRGRWLVRDIVRISELFLVRDEAAYRQIADTKARVTGDLVFDWSELAALHKTRNANTAAGSRTIALAVCPAAFDGTSEQRAVAAFSKAVNIWLGHGHRLIFLIFQKGETAANDQRMFDQIAARVRQGKTIETRILPTSPQALAAAFRDIDVLCGMRFHGFVLAALFGIPFVGVSHDNKISEICRRFNMSCFDAGTFEETALAGAAEASFTRRPDPILVERSTTGAHENFRAFAELIA